MKKVINREGLARMKDEQAWASTLSRFVPGQIVRFRSRTFHVAEGATVTVELVRMDHSHPGGHDATCWSREHLEYEVTTRDSNGDVGIRFNAREHELVETSVEAKHGERVARRLRRDERVAGARARDERKKGGVLDLRSMSVKWDA